MWKPGSLVNSCYDFDVYTLYFVVSVKETGFGTLGPKWSAVCVTNSGKLMKLYDIWRREEYYHVIWEPIDEQDDSDR